MLGSTVITLRGPYVEPEILQSLLQQEEWVALELQGPAAGGATNCLLLQLASHLQEQGLQEVGLCLHTVGELLMLLGGNLVSLLHSIISPAFFRFPYYHKPKDDRFKGMALYQV